MSPDRGTGQAFGGMKRTRSDVNFAIFRADRDLGISAKLRFAFKRGRKKGGIKTIPPFLKPMGYIPSVPMKGQADRSERTGSRDRLRLPIRPVL